MKLLMENFTYGKDGLLPPPPPPPWPPPPRGIGLIIRVTYLCDHGQPYQVGRYTHEGDEEFLPGTQEARPLVDAGRDEPLHRAKLSIEEMV